MRNYVQTSKYICVPKCNYPCATCSTENPSECTSCVAGFKADPTSLQGCTANCNATTTNCALCPFGFGLLSQNSTQTCVQCSAASNCARCNSQTPSQCTACNYGNYLDGSNVCQACPTGCGNCLNPSTCFSCKSTYVAVLPTTLVTGAITTLLLNILNGQSSIIYQPVTCAKCIQPCVNCVNSPTSCLSCTSGYTLLGTGCISDFNFNVNVVFSVNSPSDFVNNYYNLLATIANKIGQNINTISVSSIVYGSATVNFVVSTTNAAGSTGANNQLSGLQSLLMTNTTVAGMTVTTSTVVTNSPPNDNSNSDSGSSSGLSNTTIIIIAVVVPIGSISTKFYMKLSSPP